MTINPHTPPPPPPKRNRSASYIIGILAVLCYLYVSDVSYWLSDPVIQKTGKMTKQERKQYFDGLDYEQYLAYHNEYEQYVSLSFKLYEAVLFLVFFLAFLNTRGLLRAGFCFATFVSCASVIDKVFLNISEFLWTDWIIIACGVLSGIYVYLNQK